MSDSHSPISQEVASSLHKSSEHVVQYLDRALGILANVVHTFHFGDARQGLTVLGAAEDGFTWLTHYAQSVSQTPADVSEELKTQMSDFIVRLTQIISEISSGITNIDIPLLADLVEYELLPLLEELRQAATHLMETTQHNS